MFKGPDHVVTCAGIVLWDGITKPEVDDKDGSLTHNLRIAIPNNAPELAEITQLATIALRDSEYKGVMPAGGNWPLMPADPAKFGPTLAGHTCFTAKTRRGVPGIFDLNGAELAPMQFGRSFYPGAKVALFVHAYAYNNKQKGIAFGLDGVQIVDATAPALAIGGGVSPQEVANAFAGGGAAAAAPGRVMLNGADYNALKAAGWSDAQMVQHGHMAAPVAAPAPLPPAGSAPPPPPSAPAAPVGKVMVPAVAGATTYDQYIAAGWTDAALVQNGYMLA